MTVPADIFLSYNREDQAVARRYAEAFERAGFSVWWDQALKSGIDYDKATEHALRSAKAVVVLWSKQSVDSRWVRTEATIALQNQTLVPVTIEACQRPIMFELTQTADLSHWNGDANDQVWLTFLHDVQQFVQSGTGAAATKSPLTRMTGAATKRRTSQLAWSLCALFALIAAGASLVAFQHLRETPAPPPPETRLEINTPATDFPNDFALSPDGRQIVFVAADDDEERLWLRSLATTTAQPLAGTEGARRPFWSPDSHSIGFFTANALKKIELNGGAPRTLAPVVSSRGGSWSPNGTILFAPHTSSPLMQVPAGGGTARDATTTLEQQQGHTSPFFLPDGQQFLYRAGGAPDVSGIFLGTLEGSAPVRLTSSSAQGIYLSSGWLLWLQEESLLAQRLDMAQAALVGEPLTLADGVSAISSATTGLVAYRSVPSQQPQLTWVDRAGTVLGTLGEPGISFSNPRVAPDGNRVAVSVSTQNNTDIWLLDGARRSRLTFDPAEDGFALWSADGTRIAFRSQRSGSGDLYIKPANAAGLEELLVASDEPLIPTGWSADERFLMYISIGAEKLADLWVLPLDDNQMPLLFQQTEFHEAYAAFSPDGRWVAFQSNESGRNEIYLRPFVAPGTEMSAVAVTTGQWQVSTAGGIMPLWSPDGSELYYLNPEGDMMAAPITVTATNVEPGTPVALFAAHIYGGGVDIQSGRHYDVARDGRFLINRVADSGSAAPIVLIQNWNPDVAP